MPNSPAAQVYRLDQEKLVPLVPQQVVYSVNDTSTTTTDVGLRDISFPDGDLPSEYRQTVEEFAWAAEPEVADASFAWLRSLGSRGFPLLLKLFHEGEWSTRLKAARTLSEMAYVLSHSRAAKSHAASMQGEPQQELPAKSWLPKSATPTDPHHLARQAKDAQPTAVSNRNGQCEF